MRQRASYFERNEDEFYCWCQDLFLGNLFTQSVTYQKNTCAGVGVVVTLLVGGIALR